MCRKAVNKLFIKQIVHQEFKKRFFAPRNCSFFVDFSEPFAQNTENSPSSDEFSVETREKRASFILSKSLPSENLRAAFRLHSAAS